MLLGIDQYADYVSSKQAEKWKIKIGAWWSIPAAQEVLKIPIDQQYNSIKYMWTASCCWL